MMFPGFGTGRIFLCRRPTDMRKSFDTLSALVSSFLGENPLSGAMFVFLNRAKNRVKILFFDRDGYWLLSKRLEKGTFALPEGDGEKQTIDSGMLSMLLEGIKVIKKSKRFSL